MSFVAKSPKLPQTSPTDAQQASSYKEADPVPLGYGRDFFGPHHLSQPFNWRTAYGGKGKPDWQYCSIASAYRTGPINYVGRLLQDGKEICNFNYTFAPGEDSHTFTINSGLGGTNMAWTVTVYRGSETQGVNATLVNGTGQSHPPYRGTCWALWENIDLGQGVTSIPTLTLEIGMQTPAIGTYGANDSEPYGVNPFAAIYALCLEQKGGLDVDVDLLDATHWGNQAAALEALGVASRSGDLVKCHPIISQVKDAAAVLSEILAYVDGYIYADNGQLKVGWFPNQAPDMTGVPEITEGDLDDKPTAGSFPDWNQSPTSVAVVFKDTTRYCQDTPAIYQAPANRETGLLSVPQRSDRPYIHAADQAAMIAAEEGTAVANDTSTTLSVKKSRAVHADASPLMPGDVINWDYQPHTLDLACRVISRRMRSGNASDLLEIIRERGAFPTPYVAPVDPRVLPTPSDPGIIDATKVRLWFLPEALALTLNANEPRAVAALIDRAHTGIIGAYLSMSPTGAAPWTQIGEQAFFVAKCLATNGGVNAVAATIRVTSASVDFARFAAQDANAQTDDALLLLVDNELLSVGSITVVSPGTYDLAVLRGRQSTAAAAHADGAAAWLFYRAELTAVPHNEFYKVRDNTNTYSAAVATKYFKIALFTGDGQVGLAKPDDPGLSLQLPDLSADDSAGYTVVLTSEAHTVACQNDGTIYAGELGAGGTARTQVLVYRGLTLLTAVAAGPNSDQFSVAIGTLANAAATKETNDTVRCDTLTANTGSIQLTVTVAGAITVKKIFTLTKAIGGPTGATGSAGSTGQTGNTIERRYIRSTIVPATPFGSNPTGWTTAIPSGTDALWVSEATKDVYGNLVGSWSSPQRLNGNVVFYTNGNPASVLSGYSLIEGDLAFDTSDGNHPYRWENPGSGYQWVSKPFGDAAIANLAAGKITAGTIQAAISIGTLGSLQAGSGYGLFYVDGTKLQYGSMTTTPWTNSGTAHGTSSKYVAPGSGNVWLDMGAYNYGSETAYLNLSDNNTGKQVALFASGLARANTVEAKDDLIADGTAEFTGVATFNAKMKLSAASRFEFNGAGSDIAYFDENWGGRYLGDTTHPFQVRGSALCLDGCSAAGTSYAAGRFYLADSVYIYTDGTYAYIHDGNGDRVFA